MDLVNERKDWALEKLGHFAEYEKGKKPKNQFSKRNNIFKYPYVDIQAFEKGIFNSYTDGEKCRFCSEDDFLMVWDGSRSGFVGKGINGVLGSTLMKIDFPGIENHFAYYFLKSKYLEINTRPKGTGTPHVDPNLLWNYIFPIAPLPEQRAIVAKIEQLFSDLDNGIANLKKAQEQLKIYRQAVLKKAFVGELTRKWREEQTDLPSAEKLLLQIKEERERHYQKHLDEWKKAVKEWEDKGKAGKKPSRPKKPKELPPLSEEGLNELPKLPEVWCWGAIEWILSLDKKGMTTGPFGTMLKKSEHQEYGVPVLGIENIGEGVFKMPNKIFVTKEKAEELSSFEVDADDIIISRSGTIGEICKVPAGLGKSLISTNLIKLALNNTLVDSKIFIYLFQGGNVRDQVRNLCKGSTRDFLNQTILSSILFPIQSIQEQHQIVSEIETRLSVCDKLEATITEALQKSEALRQSILKKAFEGKLLNEKELEEARNAPDWEPADKLLERIKTEKEKPGTKKSFLREHSVNSLPK